MAYEVPTPEMRPLYQHLKGKKGIDTLTRKQIAAANEAYKEYSLARFKLGATFKLTQDYYGIPKHTQLKVVSIWPATRVQWAQNKSKPWAGSIADMHFELDICLEYIKGE